MPLVKVLASRVSELKGPSLTRVGVVANWLAHRVVPLSTSQMGVLWSPRPDSGVGRQHQSEQASRCPKGDVSKCQQLADPRIGVCLPSPEV
jgi:hypothetical protein